MQYNIYYFVALVYVCTFGFGCGTNNKISTQTMVSVKDFGAKGNGVTDDTQAIQKSIDFASENKIKKVFLPEGTYVVSRTKIKSKAFCLSIKSGLTLSGENPETTILKLKKKQIRYTRILYIEECRDVKVENLTFDGSCAQQLVSHEHMAGIYLEEAINVGMSNLNFINTCGDGVCLRGTKQPASNIKIDNSKFSSTGRNGITLGSGFKNILIDKCYFGSGIFASPIDSEPERGNCSDVTVTNNEFDLDKPSIFTLGGHVEVNKYHIENNIFKNCGVHMVRANDVYLGYNLFTGNAPKQGTITIFKKNSNIRILNNRIRSSSEYTISIVSSKGTSSNILIEDNQATNQAKFVLMKGGHHVNITNNAFQAKKESKGSCILLQSTVPISNVKIRGNKVIDCESFVEFSVIRQREISKVEIANNHIENKDYDQENVKKKLVGFPSELNQKLLKDVNLQNNRINSKTF